MFKINKIRFGSCCAMMHNVNTRVKRPPAGELTTFLINTLKMPEIPYNTSGGTKTIIPPFLRHPPKSLAPMETTVKLYISFQNPANAQFEPATRLQ